MLGLLIAAAAMGCSGTRIISGGPYAGVVQTPEGTIRYSLPKSVVEVEATVTLGASGKVTFDGNEFSVDTTPVRRSAKAEVRISTVADEDQYFTLRLEHGTSADDSLNVDLAPNGMLRSIGAVSTSQVGQTVKNVATIASSVIAGIAAATLGNDPRKEAMAVVCEKLAVEAGTPGRCDLRGSAPAPAPSPAPTAPPKAGTKADATKADGARADAKPASTCDRRTQGSLGELSMANLYFLARSAKHRRLWLDRRDAEDRVEERACKRAELERTAERAPVKDLPDVRTRLSTMRDLESAARADLRATSDDLDAAVRDFQLATGIDAPARAEVVRMTFELDEVPPPDMLHRAVVPDEPARTAGMNDSDVRTALKSFPRMLELYARTGIALTLTPAPYAARGATVWSAETAEAPKTRIYFRPAYTAVLTTYATSRVPDPQGGEQELLRFFSMTSDDVVHPKMPFQGFTFEPKDFAERRLTVVFDDKGRLARIEQVGRSAVAGASSAAAEALQIARDEYATTLTRIADIQDTKRRLEQNDVISEIDRLRKQRELLDARLELSGARSNYDLVLEKKRLDAELGAIQSRRALGDERGASELSSEVAALRAKLDQLTREMEELKHRSSSTTPVSTTGR